MSPLNLVLARTRAAALLSALIGVALSLSACGASDADEPEAAVPNGSGFPVTVDTAFGEIELTKKPERIVAISADYIELLDLLGEEAIVYAGEPADLEADYPWLADTYDGEFDQKLWTAEGTESPEAIARWEPDLILTGVWGVDEKLYKQLSQVAPTYTGIKGVEEGGDTSWQENLGALAELIGHDDAIVAETEAEYDALLAEAAGKLPGLEGKTFQLGVLSREDQQLWLTEYANGPITALGLVPGDGQPTGEGDDIMENAPKFSLENVDRFTADVVFIVTHEYADPDGSFRAAFEKDPRVPELTASKNGTLVYLHGPQWGAVNPASPASVRWWLPEVVPQLEKSALNTSGQQ